MANGAKRQGGGPALSFWLLATFLLILWIAGGASRADVAGQALVRLSAWTLLVIHVLTAPGFHWRTIREPAIIVLAMALVVAFQLIPLPPAIWTALPGRDIFVEAASGLGEEQPWRSLSISPGATINALSSLVVPIAVLVLAAGLTREQHGKLLVLLIALVIGGALVALVEFSGRGFNHPFVNNQIEAVSGNFANRNHFALFLAQGALLCIVWAFRRHAKAWKAAAAAALVVLLALVILATGSRSGMVVGALSLILAVFIVRDGLRKLLLSLPRKYAAGVLALTGLVLAASVLLSIRLGRADAIARVLQLDSADDVRGSVWVVVLDMVGRYFPAGTGFGTFDPAFRISEPHGMLASQYINHAHNDWLEVVLDGGIVGLALVLGGLAWFVWRSYGAWFRSAHRDSPDDTALARAGSAIILLVFIASIPDYPARTPMIMAMVALGALWMTPSPERYRERRGRSPEDRSAPLR